MTKNLVILGSTGSIGRQTLDVVDGLPVKVAALTAGTNVERMEAQCRKYLPKLAVMMDETAAERLQEAIRDLPVRVMSGMDGLMAAAAMPEADTVITAVVGMVGLRPTLEAIRGGKRIGLANKETLVCAGEIVMAAAGEYGAEIIPVDSEHSAIFQCLMGSRDRREVKRLILTCSGGPFFGCSYEQLRDVTPAQALAHPTWDMGRMVTTNSATMVNKALEVIEAHLLFDVPLEKIEPVVHRQSIVHSMVEFIDGSVIAQASPPDMRLPIALGINWPHRVAGAAKACDFSTAASWTFEPLDEEVFSAVKLAKQAASSSGTHMAVYNAANEVAVDAFHDGKIRFTGIVETIERALDAYTPVNAELSVETVLETDRWARAHATKIIEASA